MRLSFRKKSTYSFSPTVYLILILFLLFFIHTRMRAYREVINKCFSFSLTIFSLSVTICNYTRWRNFIIKHNTARSKHVRRNRTLLCNKRVLSDTEQYATALCVGLHVCSSCVESHTHHHHHTHNERWKDDRNTPMGHVYIIKYTQRQCFSSLREFAGARVQLPAPRELSAIQSSC